MTKVKQAEVLETVSDKSRTPEKQNTNSDMKANSAEEETVQLRPDKDQCQGENAPESKLPKRQSFISDVAALDKHIKSLVCPKTLLKGRKPKPR